MKIKNIDIEATIKKAEILLGEDKQLSAATKSMFEILILIITLLASRLNLNSTNSSKPPSSDHHRKKQSKSKTGKKAGGQKGHVGTSTPHPVLVAAGNSWVTKFNTNGTLNMSDGRSYTGTWNDASSREYKENIETLDAEEALEAFEGLNPVKYNYKTHKEEERLGLIAEEVPDLVAMNEKKTLSTMDLMAVLTKVVQEQQKVNEEQQEIIAELSNEVRELKKELRLRESVALADLD